MFVLQRQTSKLCNDDSTDERIGDGQLIVVFVRLSNRGCIFTKVIDIQSLSGMGQDGARGYLTLTQLGGSRAPGGPKSAP